MNIQKTYVINLKHRTDRWEHVQGEFKKMEIDPATVVRFDAIKNNQGFIGCLLSHLAVIEECKDLDRFMILEDDVLFQPNAATLTKLALEQLKRVEWDMLYLGCNPQKSIHRFSQNTYRIKNSWCAHAIIFNGKRVTDFILKNKELAHEHQRIDVFYEKVIQERFTCLGVYPIAATQMDNHSDITHKTNYYRELIIQNFNKQVM
jgi:glycosyl transferase family 25